MKKYILDLEVVVTPNEYPHINCQVVTPNCNNLLDR